MINKALRIIIADSSHVQARQLERSINRLGYYRVAPVKTLEEVWLLSSPVLPPIDVVFINSDVINNSDSGLWRRVAPFLSNVIIYSFDEEVSCVPGGLNR